MNFSLIRSNYMYGGILYTYEVFISYKRTKNIVGKSISS